MYPQFRWRGSEKLLWNPIHKKTLKNLPEERVRLRVIEYLMHVGWAKSRISTEESIGVMGDKEMRTDIICYGKDFEPKLLVECKAEKISISNNAAEQVARYNRNVQAPYLLLTNGISDYWFSIENERVQEIEKNGLPIFANLSNNQLNPDFNYWNKRGFVGQRADESLREWLMDILPEIWHSEDLPVSFLSFGEGPSEVDISHYYAIEEFNKQTKVAVTFTKTIQEGNRLIFILNEESENRAVIEVNLDLLFDEREANASLYSSSGIRTFDISDYTDLRESIDIKKIIKQVHRLFEKYVD